MDFQHDVKTLHWEVVSDGHVFVSYTGSLVAVPQIDFNALVRDRASLQAANARAERAISGMNEAREKARDAVHIAQEDFLSSHRGGYDKQGCGRRAEAEILARAVAGASISELLKGRYTYDRDGHKRAYSRGSIFKALSVKRPEDVTRIHLLIADFPEVFQGMELSAIFAWVQKKASKGASKV